MFWWPCACTRGTRDRAGGGLISADEHHRALAIFLLLSEMILEVLQLRDARRNSLGAFARELFHILQLRPQLLRGRNLRDAALVKPTLYGGYLRSGSSGSLVKK
jgi:hypothetical protein